MRLAKKYIVKGRVQGVGFRYFTNNLAKKIGINGFVKNLYDGSVEIYAIGTEEQLINLKIGISKGPSYSIVENIIEENVSIDNNFHSFFIK